MNRRIVLSSVFAATAFAALVALPSSQANAEVAYSANFKFQKEPMKLVISRTPAGSSAQILAANGAIQARCSLKHVERDEGSKPLAVDMECRSAHFSPLVRPATIFWANGADSSAPALRFGTWLEGYEQVRLNVEVDRYSHGVSKTVSRAPGFFRHKPVKFHRVASAN